MPPFTMAKRRSVLLSVLTIIALALFFGLFFGLEYSEILRHEWPRTLCTILDSHIDQRFCCEKSCGLFCNEAPFEAPICSSIISQINNKFDPLQCAASPSSCPATSGVCDGGYKCCRECCDSCMTCSQSCSSTLGGSASCGTSCGSYRCNCRCCDAVDSLSCTYNCPTCYTDVFKVTYKTHGGQIVNAIVQVDMGKDNSKATRYIDENSVGNTSKCFYNPKDFSEVLFNVDFTTWKWCIMVIFGCLPLFTILCYHTFIFCCVPCLRCVKGSFDRGRKPQNAELVDERKRIIVPVANPEVDGGETSGSHLNVVTYGSC
ncbi:hypothetical protein BKA62DRAFT_718229 [Auriculariales sp. MPI-PUGE-AT-0066]|nr:hypothetical protein BKA62DRAFT_718229 [Auriculariales sp. MPI-PUGE-AT-0066]